MAEDDYGRVVGVVNADGGIHAETGTARDVGLFTAATRDRGVCGRAGGGGSRASASPAVYVGESDPAGGLAAWRGKPQAITCRPCSQCGTSAPTER